MVQAIPELYGSITPYLMVSDGNAAIEFYRQAFGAKELSRMAGPDGKTVLHAELKFGDSVVMLSGACDQMKPIWPGEGQYPPVSIVLYVEDVDAVWKQAMAAGCKVTRELQDMFWGDRMGSLVDPFHQHWSITQHVEDVSPEEVAKRAAEMCAQQ